MGENWSQGRRGGEEAPLPTNSEEPSVSLALVGLAVQVRERQSEESALSESVGCSHMSSGQWCKQFAVEMM